MKCEICFHTLRKKELKLVCKCSRAAHNRCITEGKSPKESCLRNLPLLFSVRISF